MFSFVGPFSKRGGGRGSRKYQPEAEILVIFSIEVAPNGWGGLIVSEPSQVAWARNGFFEKFWIRKQKS